VKKSIRNHFPFSTVKTNQSTVTRQVIAFCSVNGKKQVNTLCRENAAFLDVTEGITYMYHWLLNGKYFFNIYYNTIFPSNLGLPSPHVPRKQTLIYSYRLLCQQTPDYVQTKRPNIPRQRTSDLRASLLS